VSASPLSWTIRQLALFWLAAALTSAALLGAGALLMPGPWKFWWLLPYRSGVLGAVRLAADVVASLFRERPFETTAVVGVPAVAFSVTAAWCAARLLRRCPPPPLRATDHDADR
jgi:hypothetical protein